MNSKAKFILIVIVLIGVSCSPKKMVKKIDESKFVVNGIIEEAEPSAFVNQQLVRVGDEINGATVVEIGKDYVKFQIGEEVFTRQIKTAKSSSSKQAIIEIKTEPAKPQTSLKRENYNQAKSYYEKAILYPYSEEALGLYEKALRHAQWAIEYNEVWNDTKAEMVKIIDSCHARITEINSRREEEENTSKIAQLRREADQHYYNGNRYLWQDNVDEAFKSFEEALGCCDDISQIETTDRAQKSYAESSCSRIRISVEGLKKKYNKL